MDWRMVVVMRVVVWGGTWGTMRHVCVVKPIVASLFSTRFLSLVGLQSSISNRNILDGLERTMLLPNKVIVSYKRWGM